MKSKKHNFTNNPTNYKTHTNQIVNHVATCESENLFIQPAFNDCLYYFLTFMVN